MTAQGVAVDVLLAVAVALVGACALGVAAMRGVYRKLHFVGPAALVAPVLVALAVTVDRGYDEMTTQAWLALLFVALASPVVAHATMRAARLRQTGDWRGRPAGGTGAPSPEEAPGDGPGEGPGRRAGGGSGRVSRPRER